MMPPNLLTHPSITVSVTFWIALAPSRINSTTIIKTTINEIMGNHLSEIVTEWPIYSATTVDSFMAAAKPTIIETKEKMATINPRRYPWMTANTISTANIKSMIIKTFRGQTLETESCVVRIVKRCNLVQQFLHDRRYGFPICLT